MSFSQAVKTIIRKVRKITPAKNSLDIPALMQTLNKTRGIFVIHISGGGEPFMAQNILEACIEITKKHYIGFNTNLTSKIVGKFAERIDPERVLGIVASCHIKELERLNLMNRYISNFLLCKKNGFDMLTEVVAYPPLLEEIEKYKKFFKAKGIDLRLSPFYGEYSGKRYPESYSEEELSFFDDLSRARLAMYHSRGKICNAGYNACSADPKGDLYVCPWIREPLGNLYKAISFKNQLNICPLDNCMCPLVIGYEHFWGRAFMKRNLMSLH